MKGKAVCCKKEIVHKYTRTNFQVLGGDFIGGRAPYGKFEFLQDIELSRRLVVGMVYDFEFLRSSKGHEKDELFCEAMEMQEESILIKLHTCHTRGRTNVLELNSTKDDAEFFRVGHKYVLVFRGKEPFLIEKEKGDAAADL